MTSQQRTKQQQDQQQQQHSALQRSVTVHLRARPSSSNASGEGCVLITKEGTEGSVLVKCRDRRFGGWSRTSQSHLNASPASSAPDQSSSAQSQSRSSERYQQHAAFQFTGNVLRECANDEVFRAVAREAVEAATEGFNATIMAYGQTGSGKTYTMGSGDGSYENRGIIPRALTMVFERLKVIESKNNSSSTRAFEEATAREIEETVTNEEEMLLRKERDKKTTAKISVSFVEIYNENLIDLLSSVENANNAPACVISDAGPDSGVFVRGLTSREVYSEDEALSCWFEGDAQRAVGSHAMNDRSSRSHAVFTLNIETAATTSASSTTTTQTTNTSATLHRSKIHLVDLAGSERLQKTKSTGTVMREATFINKSLSVLERVIVALGERGNTNRVDHIPYRSSKLTHLLRDALGGNCKTVMVAHVSSDQEHAEETLTTCQLAKRMMRVENNAKLNKCVETPSEKLTRLEREIKKLRAELKLLKSNAYASRNNNSNTVDAVASVMIKEEETTKREECTEEDTFIAHEASEDESSISSIGSYESSRLNEEAHAYDEFKQTNGREKVKDLSSAKSALRACKHRVRALSEQINDIKRDMDSTEKEHERRTKERRVQEKRKELEDDFVEEEEEEEEEDNDENVARIVLNEVVDETERESFLHDNETRTIEKESSIRQRRDDDDDKEEENDTTINDNDADYQSNTRTRKKEEEEEEERNTSAAHQSEPSSAEEDEEDLQKLLRPLKQSYRATFDQLVAAKNNLNASELLVSDLSAKLHDAFVVWWKNNLATSTDDAHKKTSSLRRAQSGKQPLAVTASTTKTTTQPVTKTTPTQSLAHQNYSPSASYSQIFEQWSVPCAHDATTHSSCHNAKNVSHSSNSSSSKKQRQKRPFQ